MKPVLLLIIVLQLSVLNLACSSSGSQVTKAPAQSTPDKQIKWTDDQWSLMRVARLPPASSDRRIRCNSTPVCWTWDDRAVWISSGEDNWREFYKISEGRIDGVYLASPVHGWIAKDGVLYQTDDGGTTLKHAIPETVTGPGGLIRSVYFLDANHGWAAGARLDALRKDDPHINTDIERGQLRVSTIFKTEDGGQNWKVVSLPRTSGIFDEIVFGKGGAGSVSHRRSLFFTNDHGATWKDLQKYFPILDDKERGEFLTAAFLGPDKAWLLFAGFEFETWQTSDGGKSWKESTWQIESKTSDTASVPPAPRFAFFDDQLGLFLFNSTGECEIFKTSDGGRTWSQVRLQDSGDERFFDLAVQSPTTGLLVSNEGVYRLSLRN